MEIMQVKKIMTVAFMSCHVWGKEKKEKILFKQITFMRILKSYSVYSI